MATVTCITPNCNTELAARQLRCPNCHAFRPRLSQLAARPSAEPPEAPDAEVPEADAAEADAPGADATVCSTCGAAREPGAITCPTCGELLVEPRSPAAATHPQHPDNVADGARSAAFAPDPPPADLSHPDADVAETGFDRRSDPRPWLTGPTPMRADAPPHPAGTPQRRTGRLSPFRRGRDREQTREQWRHWRLTSGVARLRRPMSVTWRVAVGGALVLPVFGVDRSTLWTPWSLFPLVALTLVLRAQQQATLLAPWELSAAPAEQGGNIQRPDGRRELEMTMSRSLERVLRDGYSNAAFRAQAGALAALCLFVLWCLGAAAAGGDSSGGVGMIGFLFALPTGLALLSAGLCRVAQRGEPPPGELAVIDLRQRDRRTLRRGATVCATAIVPMAVGLLTIQMQGLPEVEPAGASLPVVLITLWLLGLWAPAAVAAFNVGVRGQWPQRRISLMWAARLAAVSAAALVIGEVLAVVVLGAGSPFS